MHVHFLPKHDGQVRFAYNDAGVVAAGITFNPGVDRLIPVLGIESLQREFSGNLTIGRRRGRMYITGFAKPADSPEEARGLADEFGQTVSGMLGVNLQIVRTQIS